MRRGLTFAIGALALVLAIPAGAAAKSFSVTTTADSGSGSLRTAIAAANSNPGPDLIGIGITGTIDLETALPSVSGDVEIRGPGQNSLTVRRNSGSFRILSIVCCPNVTISGLTISNGLAERGAGIESTAALVLERVTVSGNEAVDSGGATAVAEGGGILSFGSLVLRESTVSGNRAVASGGTAQTVASDGGLAGHNPTEIERSTISGNSATASSGGGEVRAQAGGLALPSESTTLEGSTVSGNSATATGGAPSIAEAGGIQAGANVLISSSTITGNTAESSESAAGANLFPSASTFVRDTIVSNAHGSRSCGALAASGGFNIDDGASCGFFQATDRSFTDPGLDPNLAANGGPTLTHALLPGSAAIDAGYAFGVTTDQRGSRRSSDFGAIANAIGGDGSDVGAYELQDEVAPTVRIETGPLPRTRNMRARFTFSANEPGATLQCRIDRRSFFPCSSPLVRRVKRNRSHIFEVEATDAAGNVSTPAWRSWRVKRKRHHHGHRHHNHGHRFRR